MAVILPSNCVEEVTYVHITSADLSHSSTKGGDMKKKKEKDRQTETLGLGIFLSIFFFFLAKKTSLFPENRE